MPTRHDGNHSALQISIRFHSHRLPPIPRDCGSIGTTAVIRSPAHRTRPPTRAGDLAFGAGGASGWWLAPRRPSEHESQLTRSERFVRQPAGKILSRVQSLVIRRKSRISRRCPNVTNSGSPSKGSHDRLERNPPRPLAPNYSDALHSRTNHRVDWAHFRPHRSTRSAAPLSAPLLLLRRSIFHSPRSR
jgi:hypothetical protein